LEAYSGILQGFKTSPKTQQLMPYAPHIIQFLDALYNGKDMYVKTSHSDSLPLLPNLYESSVFVDLMLYDVIPLLQG